MSLQVNILHMQQQVNFEDGSVSNFMVIELPDGSKIMVLATDADAQKVMAEVQRTKKIFKEEISPEPVGPVFSTPMPEEDLMVFGDPPRPPSPPRAPGPPSPRQFPRAPHVESDEAGNPVRVPSRAPPEDLDEDGVPSL